MKANDVQLARRPSGGGSVYSDLGDTCWAFVEPTPDPKSNTEVLVNALKYLGVKVIGTDHGVLQLGDRQIARSIVTKVGAQTVHHGVLRVSPNRTLLTKSLSRPTQSDVPTLRDFKPSLNHDVICEAVVHAFKEQYDQCTVRFIDGEAMMNEPRTKLNFAQLSARDWIYGKTPDGKTVSHEFNFGTFDVALKLQGKKVKGAHVNSDCMLPEVVEKFEDCINEITSSILPERYLGRKYVRSFKTVEEKQMAEALLSWIVPEMHKLKTV
jgi:lipoate-protein ligase A